MEIVVPEEFKYLYVQNAERPIVKIPNPVLRQVCEPVKKISKPTLKFIDQMVVAMTRSNGIGLAAPQMGSTQRIIVIAPGSMKPTALINPVIVDTSGEQIGEEGCLSIPGLYGDVERALKLTVEAYDTKGRAFALDLQGLPARVVQHEVDHLNGVLFIDKVDLATLHWSNPELHDDDI